MTAGEEALEKARQNQASGKAGRYVGTSAKDKRAARKAENGRQPEIRVRTFRGNYDFERGLKNMLKEGWEVQSQSSRKAAWSPVTGVFTRKQVHTVTFVRPR
jgi:hypothetical protein